MRLVLAVPALAALAACGSIQSTAALMDAGAELEAARAAGAAKSSIYEYAAAEVYLGKARELEGRAAYEAAARFARKSQLLAREARKNAAAPSSRPAPPAEGP